MYQLPSQVLHAVYVSQVNLTQISESLLLTWSHSQDSTSSWLVSLHLPPVVHNNTEPSLFQNLPNKCLMPRTWCVPLILVMDVIWLPPLYSEDVCQQKKSMSKCLMFKTRTHHISLNGSPITSNHPYVISHQKVWKCLSHLLVTQPPSKKCSRESENNSQLCLEERLSSTGILVKV